MGIAIRDLALADLPIVQKIYAHHICTGLASFEEVPPDLAEMTRRAELIKAAALPWLVAIESETNTVLGYAYASPYRPRPAYHYTVENSIYVSHQAYRRGIGRLMLAELIRRCEQNGKRQMIAVIGDSANLSSIGLHKEMGFHHSATLKAVGFKFGRWVDSVLMQRPLGPGDGELPQT